MLNGRPSKMLWRASAFSSGTILGFLIGKRSKNHAAMWYSKARALPTRTDACSDFETSADTPAERASFSKNTSLYSLKIINGTVGIKLFRILAASMPFITGIALEHFAERLTDQRIVIHDQDSLRHRQTLR